MSGPGALFVHTGCCGQARKERAWSCEVLILLRSGQFALTVAPTDVWRYVLASSPSCWSPELLKNSKLEYSLNVPQGCKGKNVFVALGFSFALREMPEYPMDRKKKRKRIPRGEAPSLRYPASDHRMDFQ